MQPLSHTLTRASAPTTDAPIPTPSYVYTIVDLTSVHNFYNENVGSTITIDATTGVMTIPAIISNCALKTYTFRVELTATFGVYNEGSVVGSYELEVTVGSGCMTATFSVNNNAETSKTVYYGVTDTLSASAVLVPSISGCAITYSCTRYDSSGGTYDCNSTLHTIYSDGIVEFGPGTDKNAVPEDFWDFRI